ncbi:MULTISPECIES: tripartite tricarboxylate transporter substrate binding protein [unclassified Roseitalea]|uniref:Bug family tripartite tricarboxylate transporter substrate binding protein n=2 Tax=Roseitalea TaxID=1915401 RepID=UPI00273FFE63|nr:MULTISPECIES: tripartite tricarboxylate transporter substrate binding protein [unclassified Roseitalea]
MRALRPYLAAACGAVIATGAALAQDYPSEPIEIVVPAAAGGGTDVLVRTLEPHLEEALGTSVVVINVPGSGSVGGSRRVVEAEPDGYTALANHVTLLSAMALGKADFTIDDYDIAALSVEIPLVVVVPASSDVETLDQLMDKVRGDEPVIAGVNLGAVNHFSMLMLQARADDVAFRFVQTGGGAATTAALLGEHIDVGVLAGSEALPVVESGDVRVIAALGGDRIPYFPDVPTATEQGYPTNMGVEYMWLMPDGTPADRVEAFGAAIRAAIENEEVAATLTERGMIPSFATGEQAGPEVAELYRTIEGIAATLE